ncbi:UvrABC system protein B [Porphyridium purpureum]|uniref:UvrABC system protein B n=1 Tax=Porphyridium purpureum TaxID=35688 RepID=A0A5J4YWL8_PORPP|nr:UvrABC system protein B [Porphyridium purpureum]|eukprot:POR8057..scf209_3
MGWRRVGTHGRRMSASRTERHTSRTGLFVEAGACLGMIHRTAMVYGRYHALRLLLVKSQTRPHACGWLHSRGLCSINARTPPLHRVGSDKTDTVSPVYVAAAPHGQSLSDHPRQRHKELNQIYPPPPSPAKSPVLADSKKTAALAKHVVSEVSPLTKEQVAAFLKDFESWPLRMKEQLELPDDAEPLQMLAKSWAVYVSERDRAIVASLDRKSRFVVKDARRALSLLSALRLDCATKWVPAQGLESVHTIVRIVGPSPVCQKALTYLLAHGVRLVVARTDDDSNHRGADAVREVGHASLAPATLSRATKTLVGETNIFKQSSDPLQLPEALNGDSNIIHKLERQSDEVVDLTFPSLDMNTKLVHPPPVQKRKSANQQEHLKRTPFKVKTAFEPAGDQPHAIEFLASGLKAGERFQLLAGGTATGKTYLMAKLIEKVQQPTLVLAPNKTLASQLCNELRAFLPHNAVEYFVSYYDFFLPEAYVETTNTYIEKISQVNDDVDRLRHSATYALYSRPDVVIVASVSCIYGLGVSSTYLENVVRLRQGANVDDLCSGLRHIQYERVDSVALADRATYALSKDALEIRVSWERDLTYRCRLDEETGLVCGLDVLRDGQDGQGPRVVRRNCVELGVYPAKHFLAPSAQEFEDVLSRIEMELKAQVRSLNAQGKLAESKRLVDRVQSDIEMLKTIGYCSGVENYSRYLSGRNAGERPDTLLDYFPDKSLLIVDESHVAVPQLSAMIAGDMRRKRNLVKHGFRLPSCLDNRPLTGTEFWSQIEQAIFVSATPGETEERWCGAENRVEMVNRPTGILDPLVEVRPTANQMDQLLDEIKVRKTKGEAVLVTTVTKKLAEAVAEFLSQRGGSDLRVSYIHSGVKTIERVQLLHELNQGRLDALVGVNLLREGLDLPSVSLVVIMDADKQGFLRSRSSLIQTIGRAARHVNGRAILFADMETRAMTEAINETARRRRIQEAFNSQHQREPKPVQKKAMLDLATDGNGNMSIIQEIRTFHGLDDLGAEEAEHGTVDHLDVLVQSLQSGSGGLDDTVRNLEREMEAAVKREQFELAARIRDVLTKLDAGKQEQREVQ